MNKTIITFFCTLALSILALFPLYSQTEENKITLPLLDTRHEALNIILADINSYIINKPNGLMFPVSKIVLSQLEDLLCYEVVGIDNSWTNLFKFGEVPYGYMILQNRLFLISVQGYHRVDINQMFYLKDKNRSFNRTVITPTGIDKNPIWFFEYRDKQSYLISTSDLDILD